MKQLAAIGLMTIALFGSAEWASAHHSHAMFDTSKEVTITGTVTNFVYRNPHVFLYVEVKGENGQPQEWAVEMSNINNMERRNIFRSTFKTGDTVTVKINPLRDGRAGGNYTSVTTAEGKTL